MFCVCCQGWWGSVNRTQGSVENLAENEGATTLQGAQTPAAKALCCKPHHGNVVVMRPSAMLWVGLSDGSTDHYWFSCV